MALLRLLPLKHAFQHTLDLTLMYWFLNPWGVNQCVKTDIFNLLTLTELSNSLLQSNKLLSKHSYGNRYVYGCVYIYHSICMHTYLSADRPHRSCIKMLLVLQRQALTLQDR